MCSSIGRNGAGRHAGHQAESGAVLDRGVSRLDCRQDRCGARHRFARHLVRGRAFPARSRRDGDDIFRGAYFRQAGRRGASLRPWQDRKRDRAGGDRALVPAVRHRDLGGVAAAVGGTAPRGRGDAGGLRGHDRVDRDRFSSRARALPGRRRDLERGAGGGRPAFRLGHVVLDRGAGRLGCARIWLCPGPIRPPP